MRSRGAPVAVEGKRAPEPDMDRVHAAMAAVKRKEEALDLAKADLHTASGGHLYDA